MLSRSINVGLCGRKRSISTQPLHQPTLRLLYFITSVSGTPVQPLGS
jgi:hypothetical protein